MLIRIYLKDKKGKKVFMKGHAQNGCFEVTDIHQMNRILRVFEKKCREGQCVDWSIAQ